LTCDEWDNDVMASEAYADLGGGSSVIDRRWPPAYGEGSAIVKDCPRCGAVPFQLCVNPITGRVNRRCPCRDRILAGWN
jgi:hypothetical protein